MIQELYEDLGLLRELEDLFKYLTQQENKDFKEDIINYELFMNYYERRNNFNAAYEICEHKILKSKHLKNAKDAESKEMMKKYRQKKNELD